MITIEWNKIKILRIGFLIIIVGFQSCATPRQGNLSESELMTLLDLSYWRFEAHPKALYSYKLEVITYRDLEYTPAPLGKENYLVSMHIPTRPTPVANPNFKTPSTEAIYKILTGESSKTQSIDLPSGPGVLRALYSEPKYYQTERENFIVLGHFEYNMGNGGRTQWEKKALLIMDLSYQAPIED